VPDGLAALSRVRDGLAAWIKMVVDDERARRRCSKKSASACIPATATDVVLLP
jgi:hypothetical protein